MPIKQMEYCPKCKTECMPNDKPVKFERRWGDFFVRMWNYSCDVCDWTWANEAQRKHNEKEIYKREREAKFQSGGWMMNS